MISYGKGIYLFAFLIFFVILADTADKPPQNSNRNPSASTSNPKCGTIKEVSEKIEYCAKPLIDILEGKLTVWPKQTSDVQETCTKIAASEKCIKDTGRQCLTGLRRTVTSAVANSFQRTRKRECTDNNYALLLSLIKCIEKNQKSAIKEFQNVTAHLRAIRDEFNDLNEKTIALCCMVNNEISANIDRFLKPHCPQETKLLIRMYFGSVEDVSTLICRNVKCQNFMRGHRPQKSSDPHGIVSLMLQIVFSLDGSTY